MLLFPPVLSVRESLSIMDIISYAARNPEILEINENSSPKDIDLSNFINSILLNASIYQYGLSKIPHGKVLLSNKVYNKLCEYASSSNDNDYDMIEFGGYLYGKEIEDNIIYFEYNSLHPVVNGRGDIGTPSELSRELEEIMRYTDYDCIAHIHTHPFKDNTYALFPSNQDLYVYAYLQEQFKVGDRDVFFLGGLITPLIQPTQDLRLNDLCFIFYDRNVRRFYKCDNIFYEDEKGEVKPLHKIIYRYTEPETGKVLLKERRTLLQNENNISI